MIKFIDSKQEYIEATNELNQIFRKGIDIVDNPFVDDFKIFAGFEFDRIFSQEFYNGLVNFLLKRGRKQFTFYTLLPDPVEYFFSNFSKYSIGRILSSTSNDDFLDFLNADPGNSADSLMDNAETIAMYSNESIWGIIGSRDLEIGIVGFKDENVKNEFMSCFDEDTFIDIRTRFNDLNEMLNLMPDTKIIHSRMIKNYSRK